MRVALIAPLAESVPPRLYGGTERVVDHLCRGLTAAGVKVTLFASGDSRTSGQLVSTIDEALRLKQRSVSDPVAYNLRLLSMVAERAEEFDVIHNHHDYWMLPLSAITSIPVLTTLHGRLDLPDIGHAFRSYPQARYVSISDSQRTPLPDLNWIRTIHHGLDVSQFQFHAKPGRYLAFLGRMSPEKRPDWAIRIAQRAGVPLKMAAKIEPGPDRQYFEACVKPKIDGKFIEYIGEISESEKSDFLGNALALVFPIDWPEPFGLVTIESLACGTPVLARPAGAAPELLKDGVTGYCHADIGELARRVSEIHRIDRHGCREWVEQRFSMTRMTEDHLDVYRYLAGLQRCRAAEGKHGRAPGYRRDLLYSVERAPQRNA